MATAGYRIVMKWLLDTNVLSELRRKQCDPRVRKWIAAQESDSMVISVMSLAEIRRGVELKRSKDPLQAIIIEKWLILTTKRFAGSILPVTEAIADRWGRFPANKPKPGIDGFIAATALEHDLTVVTRNVADFKGTGVRIVNPWK
jgi:toxin FitB